MNLVSQYFKANSLHKEKLLIANEPSAQRGTSQSEKIRKKSATTPSKPNLNTPQAFLLVSPILCQCHFSPFRSQQPKDSPQFRSPLIRPCLTSFVFAIRQPRDLCVRGLSPVPSPMKRTHVNSIYHTVSCNFYSGFSVPV